jgi:hypothetical protein
VAEERTSKLSIVDIATIWFGTEWHGKDYIFILHRLTSDLVGLWPSTRLTFAYSPKTTQLGIEV